MERENDNRENVYIEHGHPRHHKTYGSERSSNRTKVWISIGAVILIILLILWLTIADLWGDTDVAAQLYTATTVTADNLTDISAHT